MLELELLSVPDPSGLLGYCDTGTGAGISSSSREQVCIQGTAASPVNRYTKPIPITYTF
jgi:hypothetical protein